MGPGSLIRISSGRAFDLQTQLQHEIHTYIMNECLLSYPYRICLHKNEIKDKKLKNNNFLH
jgi:hypothetical protein